MTRRRPLRAWIGRRLAEYPSRAIHRHGIPICSSLIAQAFQAVRYPILPILQTDGPASDDCPGCVEEILHVRHHKLFVPRDFDVSPYFQIVKPGIEHAGHLRTVPADEVTA